MNYNCGEMMHTGTTDRAVTVLTTILQCSVTGPCRSHYVYCNASTYHQSKVLICKGMIMHTEANLNQNSYLNSGYEFSISNWGREFYNEGIKHIFIIFSGLIVLELGLVWSWISRSSICDSMSLCFCIWKERWGKKKEAITHINHINIL